MDDRRAANTAPLALAIGATTIGSAVCLATFSVVGGPLGTLNDVGNAATGVLSACLAWQLRGLLTGRRRAMAIGAAVLGAGLAVGGSALVVSGTTSWVLAGLVSSVGFAGVGAWLLLVASSPRVRAAWPGRTWGLAVAAGALMATGILALPGIALRIDDIETAPTWIWLGLVGWLGIFVAYPAWALSFGAVDRRLGRFSPRPTTTPAID